MGLAFAHEPQVFRWKFQQAPTAREGRSPVPHRQRGTRMGSLRHGVQRGARREVAAAGL